VNTIPQELNWVEKRASCTIAAVFNQLCDGIADDVRAINSARSLSGDNQFLAQMAGEGIAIVVAQPNRIPRARVIVRMDSAAIVVIRDRQYQVEESWEVTVGLNDEGRCVLRLEDGAELEQWQFRKRALEQVLFGEVA
jgi:hypothetical protein